MQLLLNRWAYCCLCMETVAKICDLVDASEADGNEKTPLLIPVKSERDIAKCLQLVVATGLLPYLHPNIGIPIQKRSQFYHLSNSSMDRLSDEQVDFYAILLKSLYY